MSFAITATDMLQKTLKLQNMNYATDVLKKLTTKMTGAIAGERESKKMMCKIFCDSIVRDLEEKINNFLKHINNNQIIMIKQSESEKVTTISIFYAEDGQF